MTDLMDYVRKAETLIGDFTSEAEELLSAVQGTDAEAFDCFDELHTALGATAGAFRFHMGHPNKSGEYLAISKYGTWFTINWSEKHQRWNAFDEDETDDYGMSADEFVCYFDLPDVKEYVHERDD